MTIRISHITFTLRLGLAFAYIFVAILCFYSPAALVPYTQPLITANHLVLSFSVLGILSLALAAWILSGKKPRASSGISFIIFIIILILGIEKSFVIFAALQVLCLNLALMFSYRLGNTVTPEFVLPQSTPEDKKAVAPSVPSHTTVEPIENDPADTIL
ncbi:MAG: hypothetical protein RJB39_224 [Candidatus Parcubacteria bacterium]|jgi:hypothetical protein